MNPDEYRRMHDQEARHWWLRGRRELLVELLRRFLPPRDLRILDLGAGTGGNVGAITQHGQVVALEPFADAIQVGRKAHDALWCRGTGITLPFRPAAFDAVVAADVLEHISDDRAAIAEISRVLRPGGILIFTVPANSWLFSPHDVALHHFRRYGGEDLSRLFSDAGMSLRWLSYWNTTLLPVVWLRRIWTRRYRRDPAGCSDLSTPPAPVNWLLHGVLRLENRLAIRHALPWGVSLVGVAAAAPSD